MEVQMVNTKANGGSFKKGDRRTGRQKGSTTLKTRIVQECLLMAGEAIGEPREVKVTEIDDKGRKRTRYKNQETGTDGLVGYLKWVGLNHPAVFCAMLGKIIPMQGRVDTQHVNLGSLSDLEAIRAEIKRRGLKLERFLESPKRIEATSTDATSIAPATGNGHDPEEDDPESPRCALGQSL